MFNTILLLWLGITVWFNAERRTWGIALAGGGFILGSLFFISHSALLLTESLSFTRSNTLWLAVGMTPVVVLPFVWYVVLLWYAGYWTGSGGELRQRHRPWLWVTAAILAIGFLCLALLGAPHIPWVARMTSLYLASARGDQGADHRRASPWSRSATRCTCCCASRSRWMRCAGPASPSG